MIDYFNQGATDPQTHSVGPEGIWGYAGDPQKLWTCEELRGIKKQINAAGLELLGIENLDPAHWHDILLDGPKKQQQLENVKTIVRNMGKVGIPVLGYNFSLSGVAARIRGPFARGGAVSVGLDGVDQTPIPNGTVWNMVYDRHTFPGTVAPVTPAQLWQRLADFLNAVLPVAEEVGVTLAAHPDDPPVPVLCGQPKLLYQSRFYDRLLSLKPSPRNALEFCVGTLAEMTEGDPYEAIDYYSRKGVLAYIHLRNVRGRAPHYQETFIDEGDLNIVRVLDILKQNKFEGVIFPDHTPRMDCEAPWHAGMAYALGYLRATLQNLHALE